jgi:hypothetical protein
MPNLTAQPEEKKNGKVRKENSMRAADDCRIIEASLIEKER